MVVASASQNLCSEWPNAILELVARRLPHEACGLDRVGVSQADDCRVVLLSTVEEEKMRQI